MFFFEQVLFVVLNEQFNTETESGVFKGWNKDKFSFAPTYKHVWNSDRYDGEDDAPKSQRRSEEH